MKSVRRILWWAGAPARAILLGGIALYRLTLSGWLGGQCRFLPTCSRYAEDAIRVHGAIKGSVLAVGRVLRCNPFGRGGLDPVPRAHGDSHSSTPPYDVAIQATASATGGSHAG
jgi:putative membrane protein insertion efficiency factor